MASKEETDKKDIVKGASLNFLGFIIRLSSRLPFILLVVALYGNALYGRYVFIITTVELGAALAVFGFKRSLFKFIQDKDYNEGHTTEEVIVGALICSFLVGLGMIGLIIASSGQLAIWFDYPEMVAGLINITPMIIVISAVDIILAGTRISRNMKYEVIARSFAEPYVLLLSMLAFYFLGYDDSGVLMAYAVSIFAALGTALWGSARLFSLKNFLYARPTVSMMYKMAKFSAPTAFHDLALLVFMRMDVFTVKFFFAEGVLGIYNIAQQITTSVEKIYQSFYPILGPVMAKNLVEKDYAMVERQMVMVSRWTLMVQCFLVVIAVFYSEAFMSLIVAANTDQALLVSSGVVLVFLMIGETINGGFGMADMPILYRYPIFNPIISLIMVPLYVVIAWVFIRLFHFDMRGIAMALCAIYFLMNLVRVITIRRLMNINMLHMSLLKVVLAAGITIILFKILALILPVDMMSGQGIALGVPLLMILYWAAIVGCCLTSGDKAKFFVKFKRKAEKYP